MMLTLIIIKYSKTSIFLEIHFIDDRRLGRTFCLELLKTLKRNIRVFIIVDGFSKSSNRIRSWFFLLKKHGALISYFNPVPLKSLTFSKVFKLNQRNHKKVILIDSAIAYLGTINVDTRQMSRFYGGESWREIGIRIQNSKSKTPILQFGS